MLDFEGDLTDVLVSDGDLIYTVAASFGPEGPHADQSHRLVDRINCTQDALVPNLHGRDDRKSRPEKLLRLETTSCTWLGWSYGWLTLCCTWLLVISVRHFCSSDLWVDRALLMIRVYIILIIIIPTSPL